MSSQASPRSMGDHLRPSPPARSYRFTVVKLLFKAARLCLSLATRVIRGHTPNLNLLWKTAKKSFLVLMPWGKTGPQLAFSVIGTNDVTGHCAIEDRPRRRALSRRAGREDRRRFFCKLHCGERQVDGEIFIFGCTCPLSPASSGGLLYQFRCIMSDIVFGGWSDTWRTDLGYASVRSPDIRPPPQTISYI